MYSSILVPIDISENDLTYRVIPHVQSHAVMNNARVNFLTIAPSLNFFSSLGMSYFE